MISDEAVEAAAKGIASANLRFAPWSDLDDERRNSFRRDAKAALEAAAPHMHSAGFRDQWEPSVGTLPIYPLGKIEDKRR